MTEEVCSNPFPMTIALHFPSPNFSLEYRAIGYIKGKYIPSAEHFNRGTLLTKSGSYPAKLGSKELFFYLLKRNDSNQLDRDFVFSCYPRTFSEEKEPGQTLKLRLIAVFPLGRKKSLLKQFSIRGQLLYLNEGNVCVGIRPNKNTQADFKPFFIKLMGYLPGAKVNEFWEFECELERQELWIIDAAKIADAPKSKKKRKNKTDKSEPEKPEAFASSHSNAE